MKFLKIVIQNMFAYHGNVVFDLTSPKPGNIVLIWGRNGMGKTSFLNAVKLLFTGTANPDVRTVGFPPAQLNLKKFILGDGARWTGVINRVAQQRASLAETNADARIEITWEENGSTFTAVRWWTVSGDTVSDGVYIDSNEERLAGQAAEDFLDNILPAQLVKFFFFDGEDIKSIAESTGSFQTDIDRLLQITFVGDLAKELTTIASERRRKGMQSELRNRLDKAHDELRQARTAQADASERILEIDAQLNSDGIELRRLNLRRTNLSSGASELQRDGLLKQRKKASDLLARVTSTVVDELPVAIPLLANLRLLKETLDHVKLRLAAAGSAEANFVRSVGEKLPAWIEEASPTLDVAQATAIASFLSEKLRGLLNSAQSTGLFAESELMRIELLQRSLEVWSVAGVDRREGLARMLQQAASYKLEVQEVSEALLHIEVGAKGNAEEYRSVLNEIAEYEETIAKLNQQKGQMAAKASSAKADEDSLSLKISQLEASQDQASKEAADSAFILNIATTLREISSRLKLATRNELEDLLNDRFKKIITHSLIDRIGVDDVYTLTFFEKGGRPIGRTSLSSGMKQLAATALLWAMKDSAGREMPVIIDTPLGRIDKENQEHMLLAYYPSLSHQVIILPTNAEIDARKRSILEPSVTKHFTIKNNSGEGGEVIESALVDLP